jgi:hypothetical protein
MQKAEQIRLLKALLSRGETAITYREVLGMEPLPLIDG